MEITHQYAQNIVDMTMKVLNYNINIMDHMGVIVGSGDKRRINSFHQGAAEVIKTGKALEIALDQARELEGAKPGVNLPVYLNEKIVGVVGITGEPDEVRPFGELLKISVETMLQQAFLEEQLRMEQNARELYIRDIISGNFSDDEDLFVSKGSILGFDMTVSRIAVVIKIYGLNEKDLTGSEEQRIENDKRRIGLRLQKRRENILNYIKNTFNNPQNMISYNGSNHFIIFYAAQKSNNREIKPVISDLVKCFLAKSVKYNISCFTGIGLFHQGMIGLKRSYDEALKAIYIGEKAKKNGEKIHFIVSAADLGLEMVLVDQSGSLLKNYNELFLQNRESRVLLLNQGKLIETLKIFFECNLNQSITAGKMNISRNTLSSRLDKVKELTGYDPRFFSEAVKLKLFILINELQ